nr:glycine cleavage T C-terminal barrel domain-containing protein [Mesorhizobium silamurunense]
MVGKRSGFVGDVLRRRHALAEQNRQRLVGLTCVEADARLSGGAILFRPGEVPKGHGRGRITSVTYSPTLGAYVGLALLAGDVAMGDKVVAVHMMKGEAVRASVVSPVFLEPQGERLHG